jgi:hypothetical protein
MKVQEIGVQMDRHIDMMVTRPICSEKFSGSIQKNFCYLYKSLIKSNKYGKWKSYHSEQRLKNVLKVSQSPRQSPQFKSVGTKIKVCHKK